MTVPEPPHELSDLITGSLELTGIPGLALAVTDREALVGSGAYGLADPARREPVSARTLFEVGSIGKSFTSAALLQLHEKGLVDLYAPVTRYLPWFEVKSAHEAITLHHLLTHTAGIIGGADLSANSGFDVWALRESETGSPPGRYFHYSNVGFRVIGTVLEELTGRRYADVLRESILEPLGLTRAHAEITHETRRRLAVGHERCYDDRPPRRSDPMVPATWLETSTADGSLAMDAEELAGFLRMLLNRGRRVLSAESFELMSREVAERREGWSYGYGLMLGGEPGQRQLAHGGSMVGYGSTMLGDIDAGLGVVVLVNGPDEGNLTWQLATAALALYRDDQSVPPLPDLLAVPDADDYAGAYSNPTGRFELEAHGDRLLLDGVPLEPRGPDRFYADRPDLELFLLTFEREDGTVVDVAHGADVYVREGAPRALSANPPGEWATYAGHYRAYNPWLSNFRVLLRSDHLVFVYPGGAEEPLVPLGEGLFRLGREDWSPERLRFDALAGDKPLRATLSGGEYYRVS
jgi:D-alanyl-D-alanine carboxypeptidase